MPVADRAIGVGGQAEGLLRRQPRRPGQRAALAFAGLQVEADPLVQADIEPGVQAVALAQPALGPDRPAKAPAPLHGQPGADVEQTLLDAERRVGDEPQLQPVELERHGQLLRAALTAALQHRPAQDLDAGGRQAFDMHAPPQQLHGLPAHGDVVRVQPDALCVDNRQAPHAEIPQHIASEALHMQLAQRPELQALERGDDQVAAGLRQHAVTDGQAERQDQREQDRRARAKPAHQPLARAERPGRVAFLRLFGRVRAKMGSGFVGQKL